MARKYLNLEDIREDFREILMQKVKKGAGKTLISIHTGKKLLLSDKDKIEAWLEKSSTPKPTQVETTAETTATLVSKSEYLIVPNSFEASNSNKKGTTKYSTAVWLEVMCKHNGKPVNREILAKVLKALYLIQSHKKTLTRSRGDAIEEAIEKSGLNQDFKMRLLGVISK